MSTDAKEGILHQTSQAASLGWIGFWYVTSLIVAISALTVTQFNDTFTAKGVNMGTAFLAIDRRDAIDAQIERTLASIAKAREALSVTAETDKKAARRKIREAEESIRALQADRKDALGLMIVDKTGAEKQDGAIAIDLIHQYDLLRSLGLGDLARMPIYLMNLMLTLSMGVLGSVIFMNRDFLEGQKTRKDTWYVLRPVLGLSMAIAIFTVWQAGVMVLPGLERNPFLIAFVAIVSGMFSDLAYERLRRSGRKVLAYRPKRWAVGLEEAIDAEKRDPQVLARITGVEPDKVEAWIDGREPLDEREQILVAAWLDRPVRTLFTDLPPEKKDGKAEPNDEDDAV